MYVGCYKYSLIVHCITYNDIACLVINPDSYTVINIITLIRQMLVVTLEIVNIVYPDSPD